MSISRFDFGGIGPSAPPPDFSWFHVVLTTYGAWLPGDVRGFRTRHHREHIEGDYKSPPPQGVYTERLHRSQALLKQPEVRLTAGQQETVGKQGVSPSPTQTGWVGPLCRGVESAHSSFGKTTVIPNQELGRRG